MWFAHVNRQTSTQLIGNLPECQISSCMACTSCHRDSRFALISSTDYSSTETSGRPIKTLSVNADKSLESSLSAAIGRKFRHASIWHNSIVNSALESVRAPITGRRWNLKLFTPISQSPPKWGASGGMECHCTPSLAKVTCKVESELIARKLVWSSRFAPWMFVPLSLYI